MNDSRQNFVLPQLETTPRRGQNIEDRGGGFPRVSKKTLLFGGPAMQDLVTSGKFMGVGIDEGNLDKCYLKRIAIWPNDACQMACHEL